MTGIELIAAERVRQANAEGLTPEHDDSHNLGELSQAGAAYASVASAMARGASAVEFDAYMMVSEGEWPFEEASWKPSDDPVRNLVKAGALIAAEIDRLQRASGLAAAGSPPPEAMQAHRDDAWRLQHGLCPYWGTDPRCTCAVCEQQRGNRSADGDVQLSAQSVAAPDKIGRDSDPGNGAQVLHDGGDDSAGLSSARQAGSEPAGSLSKEAAAGSPPSPPESETK